MRRLPLLVLAPAVLVGTLLQASPASAAPAAPTGFQLFATNGGVGLTWTAPVGPAPAGYHIFSLGLLIADLPNLTGSPLTYIAHNVAVGDHTNYSVYAYDVDGFQTPTSTLGINRAADATVGTASAFALEATGQHYFMDASRPGDTVTEATGVLTGAIGGVQHGTATLPLVRGPGDYLTDTTPVTLTVDGASCPFQGTTHVAQVSFDDQLQPQTYAAELAGTCNGAPVRASLRYLSNVPYVAVTVTPETFSSETDLNSTTPIAVTVTNKGIAPLTVGGPTLTGADAASYAVDAGTCTTDLAPDASCTVNGSFTPVAYGPKNAVISLPVGGQVRTVALAGVGGHVASAVQGVVVTKAYKRNLVTWSAPSNQGAPVVSSYKVYRNFATNPGDVTTVVGATSFVDTTPGNATQYRIVPINAAGNGLPYDVDAAPNATSAILETAGLEATPGLYMVADSGTSESVRVPFLTGGAPRFGAAVSPDGNKVVYSQFNGSSDLYVADLDGTGTPVRLTSLAGDEEEPSWSPDGKTIAFTYYTHPTTGMTADVRTIPATGGTPALRIANYEHPSWLADSSRLVADNVDNEGLAVVDGSGKAVPVAGSAGGFGASVSPDGKTIAYIYDDPSGHKLATVPVAGGTAKIFADTADWLNLSWRADGTRIYGERGPSNGPQVASVGFNGTPAGLTLLDTGTPNGSPVYVAPKVHLTSFSAVTGANASIGFASTDPYVTCSFDNAAESPCTSPVAKTGLAGGKHSLVLRSYSSPGGALTSMTAAEFTADRTAPAVAITTPAANGAATTTTATVVYRATDTGAGTLNYNVRYRRASSNGVYTAYSSPSGWLGTAATSRAVAATPGYEYCFSVQARDKVGNLSAWSADRCVAIALDDRSLSASAGWTRATASGSYKSTVTSTTKAGISLSRSVQTRRVTLVVTRCASCGQVAVYLAGVKIGTVSTYAATTQRQVKIALPVQAAVRSGALVLKSVTAGKQVIIDGVALGRA